jgi:predicted type IV restriction endonuclease
MGEKHGQSCGVTCIKNGGPVGIVSDGKAYLVVGEHKPMNDELAQHCGKTVTLKGKMAERGGIAMIENAEIVKK